MVRRGRLVSGRAALPVRAAGAGLTLGVAGNQTAVSKVSATITAAVTATSSATAAKQMTGDIAKLATLDSLSRWSLQRGK